MKSLGRLHIGAHTYRCRAVPLGHKSLEGARGITDPSKKTITVADDDTFLDSLIHEIMHAILYEIGLLEMLFGHLPDQESKDRQEEHSILLATPHALNVAAQLRGVGWSRKLKNAWPKKGKKS